MSDAQAVYCITRNPEWRRSPTKNRYSARRAVLK
jgi:hypothetical protein